MKKSFKKVEIKCDLNAEEKRQVSVCDHISAMKLTCECKKKWADGYEIA